MDNNKLEFDYIVKHVKLQKIIVHLVGMENIYIMSNASNVTLIVKLVGLQQLIA